MSILKAYVLDLALSWALLESTGNLTGGAQEVALDHGGYAWSWAVWNRIPLVYLLAATRYGLPYPGFLASIYTISEKQWGLLTED